MYTLIRRFLFLFPPERVHYFSMNGLKFLCAIPFVKQIITGSCSIQNNNLEKNVFGLNFKNPVGLAAGFDKNASYLNELEALGFGFVEIGTVTPKAQSGNDKPRVFRLPADKALINRMGFNNEGVDAIVKRLKHWKEKQQQLKITAPALIIGGNIGKNKITPNEDAWKDYEICFTALFDYVDYFVVNVSSPNTPGLRALQEKESLRKILTNLQSLNNNQTKPKPILLKIAPDLSQEQIDDVIDLALEIKLDGLVAANTSIVRNGLQTAPDVIAAMGAGGLSGKPITQRATEIVAYINNKTGGQIPIIASGGIFSGPDAVEKLNAGGTLIQVWTGFIYNGPCIVKNICKYLLQ
jgi:dihydroorotate dehydrogenase